MTEFAAEIFLAANQQFDRNKLDRLFTGGSIIFDYTETKSINVRSRKLNGEEELYSFIKDVKSILYEFSVYENIYFNGKIQVYECAYGRIDWKPYRFYNITRSNIELIKEWFSLPESLKEEDEMEQEELPRKFWMVKGTGPASYVHRNEDSARRECVRLAQENPGEEFYLMEAVAMVTSPIMPIEWRDTTEVIPEVPF